MQIREPAVAGQFYSSSASELLKELKKCFGNAQKPLKYSHIRALIAPHAGYVFSGDVAAVAFSQVDPNAEFKNIFVLAPSHQYAFNGAAIYIDGPYKSPLGLVEVNDALGKEFMEKNHHFAAYNQAHLNEHSLEVQLPFLQYHLNSGFKLVPIIIGTQDKNILESMAETLKPYFNEENLFVISSDFSHFPKYKLAKEIDEYTADAIAINSVEQLLKTINKNRKADVDGLSTSACGLSGILTLLYMTKNNKLYHYHKLKYENSGDKKFGDKDRVVGYWALSVEEKKSENQFVMSEHEKAELLSVARNTIKNVVGKEKIKALPEEGWPEVLKQKCGVFVTIYINNELRGCIGRLSSGKPLYNLTREMAISAALNDSRFAPLLPDELEEMSLEISVLTPLQKIKGPNEVEIGRHGIFVKQGVNQGTLLPQVAVKNDWDAEEFLGYCSRSKAGIGWEGWKTADVFTFEALVFGD